MQLRVSARAGAVIAEHRGGARTGTAPGTTGSGAVPVWTENRAMAHAAALGIFKQAEEGG